MPKRSKDETPHVMPSVISGNVSNNIKQRVVDMNQPEDLARLMDLVAKCQVSGLLDEVSFVCQALNRVVALVLSHCRLRT